MDLQGKSARANQQQNCILNMLQLAFASLQPGKTAGPDKIVLTSVATCEPHPGVAMPTDEISVKSPENTKWNRQQRAIDPSP